MRRSCGSSAETITSEYFCTNSGLGANMRAPASSRPVRVIRRAMIPPVRDLYRVYGVMMTYASCCDIAAQPGELPEGLAGLEGSEAGVAGGTALPPRILNITVPQIGHLPLMALRPFFITSSTALTISLLALHLTQYPSAINYSCLKRDARRVNRGRSFTGGLSGA